MFTPLMEIRMFYFSVEDSVVLNKGRIHARYTLTMSSPGPSPAFKMDSLVKKKPKKGCENAPKIMKHKILSRKKLWNVLVSFEQ